MHIPDFRAMRDERQQSALCVTDAATANGI